MGPVISQQSLVRIKELIQSGVDDGAQLLLDGRDVTVPGCEKGASLKSEWLRKSVCLETLGCS